jgi:hypothetical protein
MRKDKYSGKGSFGYFRQRREVMAEFAVTFVSSMGSMQLGATRSPSSWLPSLTGNLQVEAAVGEGTRAIVRCHVNPSPIPKPADDSNLTRW